MTYQKIHMILKAILRELQKIGILHYILISKLETKKAKGSDLISAHTINARYELYTSIISKIFEKIQCQQIREHLELHDLLINVIYQIFEKFNMLLPSIK